jgi:hypothetical protein
MKRNLLTAILLFGLLSSGYSQDKIITLNYDTIDCKINKILHNTIFFDITTMGVKSSGKLPITSVLNYTISVKAVQEELNGVITDRFERLRFGMNGGPGYILASSKDAEDYMVSFGITSGQAQSYYKDLKLGLYTDADLTYLITQNYGAGIKYKFFDTSSCLEGFFDPQDGVHLIYTTYKEQIYVNFFGALFVYQQSLGSQNLFRLNSAFSFGLTTYRNEAEYLNGFYLLTGKNFGTGTSFGLEYFITSYFSAGVDLSAFYSSIRKIKITDGTNTSKVDLEKENYENLTRLDLSFGIRFYLWKK